MERFHIAASDKADVAPHYATLQRAWGALTLVIAAATALVLIAAPLSPQWKLVVGVGMASMIVRSALKVVQHRRAAEGRVAHFVVTDIAAGVGGFLAGAGLTFLHLGAAAPLAGLGLAAGACLLMASGGEWRQAAGGRFEADRALRYLRYGFPLSMSLMMSLVLASTDRFVIAAYLDEAKVGMYFAAFGLAYRPLDILFAWLGASAFPAVLAAYERTGPEGMQAPARAQIGLMLVLAVPAVAGLGAVAQPLAALMVPPSMQAGVALLMPWMALSALFAGLNGHYLEQAFTLSRRSGLLLTAMAVPALANIGLNLVLVPRFGLIGAAWATTASLGLGCLATWVMGRRLVNLPVPLGMLARCILAAAAMTGTLSLVPSLGGGAELATKVALGAAVYGAMLLLTDLVAPTGLRALFKQALAGRRRAAAI